MVFVEKGSYTGVLWWKGEKNLFPPDFSPFRKGLLTYFDRWMFTKPWPVLQTGLRDSPAFFRTWSVSSNNADWNPWLLLYSWSALSVLVGQCVEFKYTTIQMKWINLPQRCTVKYPLWWLVIHNVSWQLFLWMCFSFECLVIVWGFL